MNESAEGNADAAALAVEDLPVGDGATSQDEKTMAEHLDLLRRLVDLERLGGAGPAAPQARHELEQVVRRRVVDLAEELTGQGYGHADAAQRLGLSERTLRHWEQHLGRAAPPAVLRGRPMLTASADERGTVLGWLRQVGPGVGVPTLRSHFPDLARAELTGLLQCYRQLWRARHLRLRHVLRWQRPGTVWAIDFAGPPTPIDRRYDYLLAVRDLASGQQLLWQPVVAESAAVVIAELQMLFTRHGAPWVLKMDNGSAFIADDTRRLLQRWEAFPLFSPPLTPSYNGAIEAAIGSLKKRTEQRAALAGHPGAWTTELVEAAQRQANGTARPRRLHGATPAEVWDARPLLSTEERERFQATAERFRTEARREKRLPESGDLSRSDKASVDRVALQRALVAHDLLLFRRRRIPSPILRPQMAR